MLDLQTPTQLPSPDYEPEAFRLDDLKSPRNLKALERDILRKLRGRQSQEAMSLKLKVNVNAYGKWEGGLKRLLWNDLVRIFQLRKIGIAAAIEDIYKISSVKNRTEASAIVTHFRLNYFGGDINRLADGLEITSSRAQRWAAGKSQIPAREILKLFLYRPQHFLLLIDRLDLASLRPEFETEILRMKRIMQGQDLAPYNIAVLYFLATDDYIKSVHHDTSLISRKIHLSHDQIERALSSLEQHGAIEFNGERWVLKTRSFEYPASDYRQTIPMFNYWMYRGICYLHDKLLTNRKTEIANASSFRVFSVSKITAEKITEKIRETHHEILQLIKNSDQEDLVVRAVVMNHFGLEESPQFEMNSDRELGLRIR